MRTTLTRDEDVAAKLRAETRRTGKPLKTVLNECLRVALSPGRRRARSAAFRIEARDLGALRPGLSLDNVAELVDLVERREFRLSRGSCSTVPRPPVRSSPDAALAALAIEHGVALCTTDRDFARFPGLRTLNPLDG